MGYLIGTTAVSQKVGRCKIRSIMLSAGGVASVLTLSPYLLTASDQNIIVNAAIGTTAQVSFDGIPFDGGVTVTPDANATKYVVEYE